MGYVNELTSSLSEVESLRVWVDRGLNGAIKGVLLLVRKEETDGSSCVGGIVIKKKVIEP